MGPYTRVNVASGRQLEKLAQYSRALRAGDMVLQSGTTAIDRQGAVRGEGDIAAQIEAIMAIAEWSMGKAGGRLADVVRSRVYVTDLAVADGAGRTLARYFRDARPAATLVQVSGLARPTQLVEIELDAVDGAATEARRISSGRQIEDDYAYSRAVCVGDRVFISGSTALSARGVVEAPGDMYRQTRLTMETVLQALADAGGSVGDLVYTKTFVTDLSKAADYTRAFVEAVGDVRPTSTLLGIPGLVRPEMLIEIEAEAIIGAARSRRDIFTEHMREKPRGYARAVEVGDRVYVSGCTALDSKGGVRGAGDWAAQVDLTHETLGWALAEAGASFDDVIRRRTFTVDGAEVNRPHGQGPAWYAGSHPTSLGCRVSGLARPELLVEVEVAALKGARSAIEWIAPDSVDPLDN
ncbi:MAG TPA: Rid family hydrolase [Candidatus Limnocylindrales bacterium]|nr:Rid family hydrolase [Candidatus Limnocylindrales bacterium]